MRPGLNFATMRELLAALKTSPGKYTFASAGNGTTSHLAGELLKVRASRLWETWLRSGKRVVDVVASVLLSAAYVVLGVFLAEPARRRLTSRVVEFDNNQLKRLG